MAQVNKGPQRPTGLQALAQAMSIANSVFGIKGALDKQTLLEQKQGMLAEEKELLGQKVEAGKLSLDEQKSTQKGLLTPLTMQKLQSSGFKKMSAEQAARLGPQQRSALGFVELKEMSDNGETSPVFFAKFPEKSKGKSAEKMAADLELVKTKGKLAQLKLGREQTGLLAPEVVRKEKKFISNKFNKSNIPTINSTLVGIDKFLVDKLQLPNGIDTRDDELNKDIPGFGGSSIIPGIALTKRGKDMRQKVSSLMNMILKMRSGGAVTPQEGERLLLELKGAGTDRELLQGIRSVRDAVQAGMANVFSAVSVQSIDEWTKAGGASLWKSRGEGRSRGPSSTGLDLDPFNSIIFNRGYTPPSNMQEAREVPLDQDEGTATGILNKVLNKKLSP